MIKRLIKVLPILIVSLSIAGLLATLDIRLNLYMGELMDVAVAQEVGMFWDIAKRLIGSVLIFVIVSVVHSYTVSLYKKKANVEVKKYYLKGVFGKHISAFHQENNATYLSILTNDFNTIDTNLLDNGYEIIRSMIMFIASMWMVSKVSPWGIAIVLGSLAINIILSQLMNRPLAKHMKERSHMFEGYTGYIKECMGAFHIIKSNNLQERMAMQFGIRSEEVQHKGYIIDRIFSYVQAFQNATMMGSMYGVFTICSYMAITGRLSLGDAFVIGQGAMLAMWPIMNIAERIPKLTAVKAVIEKIETSLINEDHHEETLEWQGLEKGIELQGVSFWYEEQAVLDKVDLKFKKGGKYLIVGPSGGGKSTLLKLLRKYFKPQEGTLLVDGKLLVDIKQESFYKHIANVEQQVFIFEDTLRNNITLYQEYTEEAICEAIEQAGLTEFVKGLEDGLDTMIYDNGSNVSGGERSRIVIARGLLRKASIIFLDEAFAALDLERAKAIEESILQLKGVTVINVSHVIFKENSQRYDAVLSVGNKQVRRIS